MSQRLKRVGISNVGPKQHSKFHNHMGIRERKEGAKQVFLWVIKKGNLGLHTGRMAAPNPSPHQGTLAGQIPRRYREQVEWPTVRNDVDDQRAKSTGLSVEKIKSTENYSLVSLQGREDIAGEEKVHQEKFPTQTSGQKEYNNKKRGLSKEEDRSLEEVKGSQTRENGRSLMDSDRELLSGKALRDTLSSAILGVDGEEDGSKAGEKMLSSTSLFDEGNDLRVNN